MTDDELDRAFATCPWVVIVNDNSDLGVHGPFECHIAAEVWASQYENAHLIVMTPPELILGHREDRQKSAEWKKLQ